MLCHSIAIRLQQTMLCRHCIYGHQLLEAAQGDVPQMRASMALHNCLWVPVSLVLQSVALLVTAIVDQMACFFNQNDSMTDNLSLELLLFAQSAMPCANQHLQIMPLVLIAARPERMRH